MSALKIQKLINALLTANMCRAIIVLLWEVACTVQVACTVKWCVL